MKREMNLENKSQGKRENGEKKLGAEKKRKER